MKELLNALNRIARALEDISRKDLNDDHLWTCKACGCSTNYFTWDECVICETKQP